MRGYIVDQQHSVFGQQQLVVQRAFFAAAFPETPDDLYARGTRGVVERARYRVAIQPHATLSTNTFFGRFPASYWQRWTDIKQVEFTVIARGSGSIKIRASDVAGDARTVATTLVEDADGVEVRLLAQVDKFVDGGALWLEASTGAAELMLESACWSVSKREKVRPTAVVMCTYNRADDCLRTLDVLSRDNIALATVASVYVIDQGSDTVESRTGFTDLQHILGGKLHYIRQANLGGVGGFTRGLYEVMEVSQTHHPHIMFMDDDILLEPDTVVRVTTFANCTVTPAIVGGQMLYLLHPDQLHVGAEDTDLTTLRAGLPVKDSLIQSNLTRTNQEIRIDAGYNAWWACLIPAEIVTKIGYPLPVFFQWDDIEYGLRARAHGYPTVTLPGAGVWHADFHWKDWDDWPRYFSIRNSLIVNALHGRPSRIRTARFLVGQLLLYIASMRYGLAATLIMAVEDFLAGPEILSDGGVEAVTAVRKLRAEHGETSRHPANGIPGIASTAIPVTAAAPAPSRPTLVLAKRLIWQFLRKPRGSAAVSARDSHWWHVSLFRTAVVTEPSQEGVRVRRLDQASMRKLGGQGLRVLVRLVREQPRVRRQYRAAMPTLTSRKNWKRILDTAQQGTTLTGSSEPVIDSISSNATATSTPRL
jgi:galactofuranosylgalactofuranosylrhamnosyl-N-acetylglucosaminyl-diphospho-decaprenol beta-1,5/1,6-galactofuranosyltransferase